MLRSGTGVVPLHDGAKIADLIERLRECADTGADPTKWDYISLLGEAADALEYLEELATP